jgi:hypothetical protein
MTRKDYIKIAKVISEAWFHSHDYREAIANNFADMLEEENPRFDRERFLVACGALPKCDKCSKRAKVFTSKGDYCSMEHFPAWVKKVKANA